MEDIKFSRKKIALIHLLISLCIAGIVALLVFQLWYPYPYGHLTGGLHLFLIVITVDLICGPLFTLILANPKKSKRELTMDLSLIAIIQIAALSYGLYSVKQARPVVLSYETDRIAVVTEAEIDKGDLPNAPEGLQHLPLHNMLKVSLRKAKNQKEFFESINLSMEGIEPSLRPSWWRPFDEANNTIKEKMLSVNGIAQSKLDSAKQEILKRAVQGTSMPSEDLFYLPLTSKYSQEWIVLLDKNVNFVGYAELNGFEIPRNP